MLENLQKKWKVNGLQLLLILCTFAIGGSLTGFLGRRLLNVFAITSNAAWIALYLVIITVLWPVMVILVSILFGQYRFFTKYLLKIGSRMGLSRRQPSPLSATTGASVPSNKHIHIAIFASGAGSNAQQIIEHFRKSSLARVTLILSNKPQAGVLNIAQAEHLPSIIIERDRFYKGDGYVPELRAAEIHFIVLAGFLWKVPTTLINAYPGKIINIHPALLPKYGGKGMFGQHVHQAVLDAGDTETGITIHYVDEQYDHGAVIFQATCPVLSADDAHSLAKRIHQLEHLHFPRVIEETISSSKQTLANS